MDAIRGGTRHLEGVCGDCGGNGGEGVYVRCLCVCLCVCVVVEWTLMELRCVWQQRGVGQRRGVVRLLACP